MFAELSEYCHLAKKHDYIEVTEWHNGEGIDANISSGNTNSLFQLTWGELKALKKLTKKLAFL